MSQQKLMALEARIDELIREHHRLKRLVDSHEEERLQWQHERARMQEKQEQARERLNYVIARLKEFEQA